MTELISLPEVARRLGVTRTTPANWARRYKSFPPSVAERTTRHGVVRLYETNAVLKWVEAFRRAEGSTYVGRGFHRAPRRA